MLWIAHQAYVNANLAAQEKVKGDLNMGEALLEDLYPGPWHLKNGQLYKGEALMNYNYAIIDKVGRLTGDTCTIFQGDTRVATNVMRNSKRAIGTKVSDEVAQVVLRAGEEFFGEAEVVGVKYQTAYRPIKDNMGNIIGIWYVGANKQYVDKMFKKSLWNVGSIICLNFLIMISLIWLLNTSLVRPIRGLVNSANRLATGDLSTRINVKRSQDEVGTLVTAFERMRRGRKRAEEELRAAHQQLMDIIEFLPDATFVINQNKKVIAWNKAIEEMCGVKKEDIIGKDIYSYPLPFYTSKRELLVELIFQQDKNIGKKYNDVQQKGNMLFTEISLPAKDNGIKQYLWITASPLYNSDGQLVGAIESIRDITERKLTEKQLHHLATHDSLTNIPNRYYLEEALKKVVAKARRGKNSSLLLIDLDNFKMVNDTLGHNAGDKLLVSLTEILRNHLRGEDVIARLGGDEFAVLLEGASVSEARTVAEKLRTVIEESQLCLVMYKSCFNISLSIGITIIDGTVEPNKLLGMADTALYKAKESGKNKVIFLQDFEGALDDINETNKIITLIKKAVKENGFTLRFQPVVSVNTEETMHYEVLIRMKETNGELIYPDKFIPIAERFGLMSQIDRWVVKSSIEFLAEHHDINLFVNLSGVSLGDEKLLNLIEQSVIDKHIDPSRIGFEITETAAVKDLEGAKEWINKLKRIGCKFSLDDFGKGFSSFYHLKTLPVDYIKIDGTFIRNLHKESTQFALVQAISTVANTLSKQTVAEFVENSNDFDMLKKMKIDYAQGYYLGRPVNMEYNSNEDFKSQIISSE
ncbi:MAG: EAL domain-containing protein [Firmicutes bacterium]|nr:EAL domain-containing protein [Bacillota bacterium]